MQTARTQQELPQQQTTTSLWTELRADSKGTTGAAAAADGCHIASWQLAEGIE
jgi:hypothetical protein